MTLAVSTRDRSAAVGRLDLRFTEAGGRTVLSRVRSRQPLQIGRVLDRPGGWVEVYLLNPSGGLLGGDDLEITIALDSGAKVRLRTTGATKVYRSIDAPTRQRLDIAVASGAELIYVPDPLIPFADAWLEQETRVDLEPGGAARLGEVVGPGRAQRGERFAYRCLSFRLDVQSSGRRLVVDRARIEPARWASGAAGRLGPHSHFARLFLLGRAGAADPEGPPPAVGVTSGWSTLPNQAGTLATALGNDAHSLQSFLEESCQVKLDHEAERCGRGERVSIK